MAYLRSMNQVLYFFPRGSYALELCPVRQLNYQEKYKFVQHKFVYQIVQTLYQIYLINFHPLTGVALKRHCLCVPMTFVKLNKVLKNVNCAFHEHDKIDKIWNKLVE